MCDLGTVTTSKFILEDIIYHNGCSQFIKTNNGANFNSHIIPKLNKLMAICGVLKTPYHPEANGTFKHVNRILNILFKIS